MWRSILIRVAAVLLAFAVFVLPAAAQRRADRMQYQSQPEEELERGPPVPQYALALLGTILIMLILCMPSRKRVIQ